MTFRPCPKGRPVALEREDRRKKRLSRDEKESDKVHARSGNQCEVYEFVAQGDRVNIVRCQRRRMPGVHHMLGGFGVRARGKSALAAHKQDVCGVCHSLITQHILQRQGGPVPYWTDPYVRVK